MPNGSATYLFTHPVAQQDAGQGYKLKQERITGLQHHQKPHCCSVASEKSLLNITKCSFAISIDRGSPASQLLLFAEVELESI